MKCYFRFLFVICVALFSTNTFATAPLTTEDFSQLPDVSRLVLSPNGKKLASTIRINVGETQGVAVQILDLETKEKKDFFVYG